MMLIAGRDISLKDKMEDKQAAHYIGHLGSLQTEVSHFLATQQIYLKYNSVTWRRDRASCAVVVAYN